MNTGSIVVFCTVPSEEAGRTIAEKIVGEQLAACVNITGEILSIYRWKGELCRDPERLCIIKTRADLFPRLESAIREAHPYEVPEIIALPVVDGHEPYLRWIGESVTR